MFSAPPWTPGPLGAALQWGKSWAWSNWKVWILVNTLKLHIGAHYLDCSNFLSVGQFWLAMRPARTAKPRWESNFVEREAISSTTSLVYLLEEDIYQSTISEYWTSLDFTNILAQTLFWGNIQGEGHAQGLFLEVCMAYVEPRGKPGWALIFLKSLIGGSS